VKAGIQQRNITRCIDKAICLFEQHGHAIYWLGVLEPTIFRTNTYLITDGDEALIVDPGNRSCFEQIRQRVAQIIEPEKVTGMIICHQDPDVAASMPDWLALNPDLRVFTSPRTQVLLPYYGCPDYHYVNVEVSPVLSLDSGAQLKFIPAPFLHFPGAFASFDVMAGCLFSGDVFSSVNVGVRLLADDFESLADNMRMFHVEYMASNIAARGFIRRLDGLEISGILPQHGCLIGTEHAPLALKWLAGLQCGTDIIYPDLD